MQTHSPEAHAARVDSGAEPRTQSPSVYVGIATAGRREQLGRTLEQLARQSRLPDKTIVCPASAEDFDGARAASTNISLEVVRAPRGLCAQRNAILDVSGDADILVFFDDDYYPARDYIENTLALFERYPDVTVATSWPKHDGATGPGIAHDEAIRVIETYPSIEGELPLRRAYGGYGCNMAIRLAPVREHRLRFDERLPLYGWLEDVDFTRRLAPFGRIVACDALRGVHLGTKAGRGPGLRFGYSQIANPLYIFRKGSVSPRFVARQILRNVARNVTRSVRPEPWVDRRGRLLGNVLALKDLLRGTLAPENILNL
ncbi:MAG: glycosyltransferase family 2 protein [Myxococcota bacterium]|nr:glycosyltransferase family 2 protein [Myxococcota bacterium]